MILDISENTYSSFNFEDLGDVFDPFWNELDVFVEECILKNYPIDPVIVKYIDGEFEILKGENILETVWCSKHPKVRKHNVEVIIINVVDENEYDKEFCKKYCEMRK